MFSTMVITHNALRSAVAPPRTADRQIGTRIFTGGEYVVLRDYAHARYHGWGDIQTVADCWANGGG
jgi:hypothetical protein